MNELTLNQISELAREAQIAFCLDKYPSFEVALARKVEAAALAAAPDSQAQSEMPKCTYPCEAAPDCGCFPDSQGAPKPVAPGYGDYVRWAEKAGAKINHDGIVPRISFFAMKDWRAFCDSVSGVHRELRSSLLTVAQWQMRETVEDEWQNIEAYEAEFCRTRRGYFVRALYEDGAQAAGQDARDAARYRLLRDNSHPLGGRFEITTGSPPVHLYGDRLDDELSAGGIGAAGQEDAS